MIETTKAYMERYNQMQYIKKHGELLCNKEADSKQIRRYWYRLNLKKRNKSKITIKNRDKKKTDRKEVNGVNTENANP
jgi:hypothetical protein